MNINFVLPSQRDATGLPIQARTRARLPSAAERLTSDDYEVRTRKLPGRAHQVLHRSGAQMNELTAYIFKSKAKY